MARRRRERAPSRVWMRRAHVIQSAEEKRSSDLEPMYQVYLSLIFPFKSDCVKLGDVDH
jgi:hypothetical protein